MLIKKSFFTIVFLFLTTLCFANNTLFEFEPEFGFLNGTIVENVWKTRVVDSKDKLTYYPTTRLSRLDWQSTNIPYFGFNTKLFLEPNWFTSFNAKFNTQSKVVGIMEDYDWTLPDPIHLTNYSKHDNFLNNYCSIYFLTGYEFNITSNDIELKLTPFAGFHVEYIFFEGIGGYKTYEEDNWEVIPWKEDEKVITYSQSIKTPFLGFNINTLIENHIYFNLSESIHYIIKLIAIDHHCVYNGYFKDEITNSILFEIKAAAGLKFNKNKIGITGSVSYIPDSYGFTYNSSKPNHFPKKPSLSGLGGTSRILWSYGLTYTISY